MLDNLKRFFKAPEGINVEEVDMTAKEGQPELVVDNKTAELTAQLEAAQSAVTQMSSELATLKAAFTAIEKEKSDVLAKAATDKAQMRREKVEATLGTAKSEEVLAATANLDDASFEAIVGAFANSFEKEATSPTFKEKGLTADVEVDVKPTHFKKFIK
jgi:hypothetical protein